MKIFVLERSVAYEGSSLVGLFTTEEAAIKGALESMEEDPLKNIPELKMLKAPKPYLHCWDDTWESVTISESEVQL